jgi:hypothetical protein
MTDDLNIRKERVTERTQVARISLAIAYGIVGWGLCGATMGVAMAVTNLGHALLIHAFAAPAIFVAVSVLYFRHIGAFSPLRTAVTFLAVVIVMDLFFVALLIERSLAMFESLIGTWLPFASIFLSTWLTGVALRRANRRKQLLTPSI